MSDGLVPAHAWLVVVVLGVDLVPIIQWTALGAAFWLLSKTLDGMWARVFQARQGNGHPPLPESPGKAQGRVYSTQRNPRTTLRA